MKAFVVLVVLAVAGAAQTTSQDSDRQRLEWWTLSQGREKQERDAAEHRAASAHHKEVMAVGNDFAEKFNAYRGLQLQGGTNPAKLKEVVKLFNKWLDTEEGKR